MARRRSARSLMKIAVATDNMELAALITLAGSLDILHQQQAHQPVSIAERARRLTAYAQAAVTPAPAPLPVRA